VKVDIDANREAVVACRVLSSPTMKVSEGVSACRPLSAQVQGTGV
jgi:hypothetical protein